MENKEQNNSGPAFPGHVYAASADGSEQVGDKTWRFPGMTLREYFAGQALIGLVTNPEVNDVSLIAQTAYQFADAMLEARKS